jgi:hypothetical protein
MVVFRAEDLGFDTLQIQCDLCVSSPFLTDNEVRTLCYVEVSCPHCNSNPA